MSVWSSTASRRCVRELVEHAPQCKGMSLGEVERWLASNLDDDPAN
jgi:hypothetical protein